MPGLYALILTVSVLVAWGLYEMYRKMQKKVIKRMLEEPGEDSRHMNRIVELVYMQAQAGSNKSLPQNKVSKVVLMEELDLKPKQLKHYIEILQKRNIVKESTDSVAITPFGVEFYTVFNNEINIS